MAEERSGKVISPQLPPGRWAQDTYGVLLREARRGSCWKALSSCSLVRPQSSICNYGQAQWFWFQITDIGVPEAVSQGRTG